MKNLLSGAILFVAALVAAATCFLAWREAIRPRGTMWLLFAWSAAFAALGFITELLPAGAPRTAVIHGLWLTAYALLFAALLHAVHMLERGSVTDLVLDAALVVAAAALVIVRWAPGAHMALNANTIGPVLLIVFAPSFALSAVLVLGVLLTSTEPILPQPALGGVLAAIILLVVSVIPQIGSGSSCCHTGAWTTFAAIGVWVALTYASVWAAFGTAQVIAARSGQRLRVVVAPTVAIVLATVSIESAFNPPLGPRAGLMLGVLGALVAIRLTELLNATRLQATERRELYQARALVEVSRALAGKMDLDTTLSVVTHWAVRVLHARAAAVEMLSPDGKTLTLRAAEGMPGHAIGMKFPVERSFTGWVIQNGEARVTANPRRDPYITAEGLRLLGDSPVAAMPLRFRDRILGVLSCVGTRPFNADDLDMLRAFANQTALALEDARLFDQVRALSAIDPLTGLANRRQLDRELAREFAAAQRGRRLVAIMFDLDDFKLHNDRFGHVAGDEALRLFADALNATTRTMNLAARFGGDEFFSLLADSDRAGALVFVKRVRRRFERAMENAGWPAIGVSAGMAEYVPEMKAPEDLLEAADRALYVEKFEANVKT